MRRYGTFLTEEAYEKRKAPEKEEMKPEPTCLLTNPMLSEKDYLSSGEGR